MKIFKKLVIEFPKKNIIGSFYGLEILAVIYLEISQATKLGIPSSDISIYSLGILSAVALEIYQAISLKIPKYSTWSDKGNIKEILEGNYEIFGDFQKNLELSNRLPKKFFKELSKKKKIPKKVP